MLPLPLASAVSIKRIVKSYLIRAEEVHKMLSLSFYEFGQCLHCYCNTALSCGSGKCAFRAQYIMNLDGTSVPFVSVCLLTVSCLPSAVFLPMRHFGQCLVWQHCTPAERAVWFRAVYYPWDLRQSRSNPHYWAHISTSKLKINFMIRNEPTGYDFIKLMLSRLFT